MRISKINLKTLALALLVVVLANSEGRAMSNEDVARSVYWRRLLHYQRDAFGRDRSEVDSSEFFLNPNGRVDARAELEDTLLAFRRPPNEKIGIYEQHPQCVYPERYRFLKETGLAKAPEVSCTEYLKWKNGIHAKKVTLVFAASYLGNPASMFGHTFLRLDDGGIEILSAGVSFDAVPENDNKIIFALKGLLGGYSGVFSQQPYYLKIKTYSHLENRDLWEIELELSQEQIDRMMAHLWELGGAKFTYYFFDKNCSYQLLSLLEIADPNWVLRDRFRFMAVPIDTVRAVVNQKSAVRDVHVRRSLFSRLMARYRGLPRSLQIRIDEVRSQPDTFGSRPEDQDISLIDTLLDLQSSGAGHAKLEERLLLARAEQNVADTAQFENETRLMLGHRTSKVGLFFGTENGRERLGIAFRPVLHDELDAAPGYAAGASVILGRLGLSYLTAARKAVLDDFTFIEVKNRSPATALRFPPSWAIGLKIARPVDTRCLDCMAGTFHFGLGVTRALGSEQSLVSLMAHFRGEVSNAFADQFDQSFRMSPSVQLISTFAVIADVRAEAFAEQFLRTNGDRVHDSQDLQLSGTLAWAISPEFETRFQVERHLFKDDSFTDARVALAAYF